jgi:hypothetical protein
VNQTWLKRLCVSLKAVNRGDKRTRRDRDRDFVKFERSRRYRDRYHCQEKKSCRGRALGPVFRDPPTPRTRAQSLFAVRDSPPPPPAHFYIIADPIQSAVQYTVCSTVYSMQCSIQYTVSRTITCVNNFLQNLHQKERPK